MWKLQVDKEERRRACVDTVREDVFRVCLRLWRLDALIGEVRGDVGDLGEEAFDKGGEGK